MSKTLRLREWNLSGNGIGRGYLDSMKKLSKSTLRWYIGTKSLMPIVEIRRRFGIDGDEVTVLHDEQGTLFVGLPEQAAQALEDLRQSGKIGYEFAVDFNARVLMGAYVIYSSKKERAEHQSDEPDSSEDAA